MGKGGVIGRAVTGKSRALSKRKMLLEGDRTEKLLTVQGGVQSKEICE